MAALEPTFGAINLEDIKAPECFIVERKLRERMKIPVFHDDQHGTAIIVGGRDPQRAAPGRQADRDVRLVASGAGAAALACLDLLVSLGMKPENILVTDIEGVVYEGRTDADGPVEGALRAADQPAHAGRGDRGCGHLPGPVGRRRAQAGDGARHGADGR